MAGEHLRTNAAEENFKVYVQVILRVDTLGRMVPTRLQWEDGRWFDIDRVLDVRPGPAHKEMAFGFNELDPPLRRFQGATAGVD